MTLEEFKKLAEQYNLIPVYKIITADMLTPVLAYLKLRDKSTSSFLLESVEGSVNMARFSFIAKNPELLVMNKKEELSVFKQGKKRVTNKNVFQFIREELKKYKQPNLPDLPDFAGGMAGFIGYENIALIEKTMKMDSQGIGNYDSILRLYKTILAFDHYKHQVIVISNVFTEDYEDLNLAYETAINNIKKIIIELNKTITHTSNFKVIGETEVSVTDEEFYKYVEQSKNHITEGDIFQIVLSKRFAAKYKGDTYNVYRALRTINPSPYMYYFEFENDFSIMGTSPENLIKIKNRRAQLLPIAGTRGRGKTEQEDVKLEDNLLKDEKELAEHTMLVDLGRNDLGRVCKYGTVEVIEHMKVQRYSHVMHIVSKVEGQLMDDKDVIDALEACFSGGNSNRGTQNKSNAVNRGV